MVLKSIIAVLVTFFVVFPAHADQKGLSFLNQPNAPQSQIEWFVDSNQGTQWSFNLKGKVEQLVGAGAAPVAVTQYRARIVDRASHQALIPWQGSDDQVFESGFYFLLTTGDADLIAQLQNPSDNLDLEISFKSLKGSAAPKNHLYKISLREYCDTFSERVLQPFTGQTGCFRPVADTALSGRCTAAEQDTFCNSAFNDKRTGIEKKLGCTLSCTKK